MLSIEATQGRVYDGLGFDSVTDPTLMGIAWDGTLYDVDPLNGSVSNPRPTGLATAGGIAQGPDGMLYAMTTSGDAVFRIDPATGATTQVAAPSVQLQEGDLDFDPTSGVLYLLDGLDNLLTLDLVTGDPAVVGALGHRGNFSAMAFDGDSGSMTLGHRERTKCTEWTSRLAPS